jgi:hypothetical protein
VAAHDYIRVSEPGWSPRSVATEQNDPSRGIGAARDYTFQQFKDIAATSDGRMSVRLQSFTQPPVTGESPRPVRITSKAGAGREHADARRPAPC